MSPQGGSFRSMRSAGGWPGESSTAGWAIWKYTRQSVRYHNFLHRRSINLWLVAKGLFCTEPICTKLSHRQALWQSRRMKNIRKPPPCGKCVSHWYEVPTGFCHEITGFHWIFLENHRFLEVFINIKAAKVNYISMRQLETQVLSFLWTFLFAMKDIIKVFRVRLANICFTTGTTVERWEIMGNHCRNFPLENRDGWHTYSSFEEGKSWQYLLS